MALDARHRTSIYQKLVPILGDDDTNALMTEFPSIEADELVTRQFLRAELELTKGELRSELHHLETRLLVRMGAGFAANAAITIAAVGLLAR